MGASKLATVAGRDVGWLLADRARRFSDRPWLVWEPFDGEGRTWSYAAFYDDVRRVAGGLQAAGLESGDTLLLHLDNSPEALIAWFASALVGTIAVTTNTGSRRAELAYFVEHARPKAAITQSAYRDLVREVFDGPMWVAGDAGDETPFAPLLASSPAAMLTPEPLRPLSVQYTSGSTGRPKGVLWSHGNALWGAMVSAQHQRLQADDVYLCCLPFFHTNAQTYTVLPTLWAGGVVVLQPRFSASRFWPVALERRCTRTSLVPFCLATLRARPVPPDHAFRTWGVGVALPDAEAQFGVGIIGWWGMTETIAQGIVTDPAQAHPFMSMGFASSAYEIALRDPAGPEAPAGAEGQLHIRGERGVSLFLEYFRDPAATAAAFDADGWFATGDLARMGERGDIFFGGRMSDMIKCGGENVSAVEVERVIAQVAGVQEVAVVGQPSRMYGEAPVAFVVAPAATEDLPARVLARCREELSAFKVPRRIVLIDDLPRAALNKVAKGRLRQDLAPLD